MTKKTKKEVVEELTTLGIPFDEKSNYAILCKLLKESKSRETNEPVIEQPTVGAFGEDLQTNEPVVDIGIGMPEGERVPDVPMPKEPKPKAKPDTWPFNKSNVANERREMEQVARRINMKYDNPGTKYITKVVVYDCQSRQIVCEDYKIEY